MPVIVVIELKFIFGCIQNNEASFLYSYPCKRKFLFHAKRLFVNIDYCHDSVKKQELDIRCRRSGRRSRRKLTREIFNETGSFFCLVFRDRKFFFLHLK